MRTALTLALILACAGTARAGSVSEFGDMLRREIMVEREVDQHVIVPCVRRILTAAGKAHAHMGLDDATILRLSQDGGVGVLVRYWRAEVVRLAAPRPQIERMQIYPVMATRCFKTNRRKRTAPDPGRGAVRL